MKKTGKALSLVLSLALVVSSLATSFASAAAEDPTAGATLTLGYTSKALLEGDKTETALPSVGLSYTASNGKVYSDTVKATDVSWSSSNTSVVTVDTTNGKLVPGTTKGTATVTASVSGKKLYYKTGDSTSTDSVTVSGSASVTVAVEAAGDYFVSETSLSAGEIPDPTTALAVNDAPTYALYKVAATPDTGSSDVTYTSVSGATFSSSNSSYIAITTGGAISAQVATNVHIASTQVSAFDTAVSTTKAAKTLVIHTAALYNTDAAGASTTISADTSYGSGKAITGDKVPYTVTGYALEGTTVNLTGGTVASIAATTANISGGKVTGTVTGGAVNFSAGSIGSIDATDAVEINPTTTAATVGNVASNSTVDVNGSKATVGNVRAFGKITVENGATTGSLTGVADPSQTAATKDFALSYSDVIINSAKVNGDVIGHSITVDGIDRDSNNVIIPAVVNGNISSYANGLPDGAEDDALVQIGSKTSAENVTVTGSVVDNSGKAAITVAEATDGTTKVGGVVGCKPADSTKPATTTLNLDQFTGTFASLPYFTSIDIMSGSNVTVSGAISTDALSVDGSATLAGATVGKNGLSGTGTITMPAGSLVVAAPITGSLTLVPTSAVSAGTVIFKSVAGQANNITVPGVTLQENDNGDHTYSYVAKTVVFAGIKFDNTTLKIAKGYTGTLTVSAVPAGTTLPAGDSIKWDVPTGAYVTVTPAANTLSASLYANSYSDVDLGGANEVAVKAYVVDKNGNEVYDYAEQTANVTVIAKPETPVYTSDTNGNVNMKTGATYQFKITSSDGSVPSFGVASNGATVAAYTKSGNAYFFKVTAAKAGTFGVYVGGAKVAQLVITAPTVTIDTKAVTVKAGKTYQFKVTAPAAPTFAVAGVGTVKASSTKGNDYFFKVTATNKAGVHGVYVNGAKVALITFA